MTDTDLHTAIEGLRDEWREYQEQYERESNESVGTVQGVVTEHKAFAAQVVADRLDSILASHPRGEAEQLRAERDEARWGEGWPNLQGIEYCVKCDDPNDLLSVPNESCGHDGTVNRRRGSIEVVPLSRAEAWRLRAEAAEAERDRLREALEEAESALELARALAERVTLKDHPEATDYMRESFVQARDRARSALSEQEGGGEAVYTEGQISAAIHCAESSPGTSKWAIFSHLEGRCGCPQENPQ